MRTAFRRGWGLGCLLGAGAFAVVGDAAASSQQGTAGPTATVSGPTATLSVTLRGWKTDQIFDVLASVQRGTSTVKDLGAGQCSLTRVGNYYAGTCTWSVATKDIGAGDATGIITVCRDRNPWAGFSAPIRLPAAAAPIVTVTAPGHYDTRVHQSLVTKYGTPLDAHVRTLALASPQIVALLAKLKTNFGPALVVAKTELAAAIDAGATAAIPALDRSRQAADAAFDKQFAAAPAATRPHLVNAYNDEAEESVHSAFTNVSHNAANAAAKGAGNQLAPEIGKLGPDVTKIVPPPTGVIAKSPTTTPIGTSAPDSPGDGWLDCGEYQEICDYVVDTVKDKLADYVKEQLADAAKELGAKAWERIRTHYPKRAADGKASNAVAFTSAPQPLAPPPPPVTPQPPTTPAAPAPVAAVAPPPPAKPVSPTPPAAAQPAAQPVAIADASADYHVEHKSGFKVVGTGKPDRWGSATGRASFLFKGKLVTTCNVTVKFADDMKTPTQVNAATCDQTQITLDNLGLDAVQGITIQNFASPAILIDVASARLHVGTGPGKQIDTTNPAPVRIQLNYNDTGASYVSTNGTGVHCGRFVVADSNGGLELSPTKLAITGSISGVTADDMKRLGAPSEIDFQRAVNAGNGASTFTVIPGTWWTAADFNRYF